MGKIVGWLLGGSITTYLLAGAVLIAGAYVAYSEITLANRAARIAELQVEAHEARRLAAANVIALDRVKAEAARNLAAVARERALADRRARTAAEALARVQAAPGGDLPAPEPIERALDLMRVP